MSRPTNEKVHFLYRAFDKDGKLIYVGMARCAITRIAQHEKFSHWFHHVTQFKIEKLSSRQEAAQAEKKAILEEHPIYNYIFNPDNPKRLRIVDLSELTPQQLCDIGYTYNGNGDIVKDTHHEWLNAVLKHHKKLTKDELADIAENERMKDMATRQWEVLGWEALPDNVYRHRKTGEIIHHKVMTRRGSRLEKATRQ